MKVHILMGLPGSGKTTWAQQYKDREDNKHKSISIYNLKDGEDTKDFLYRMKYSSAHHYIIDGAIYTNKQLLILVTLLVSNISKHIGCIEVHHWQENRKQCLFNNRHRQRVSIRNLPFDTPDKGALEEAVQGHHIKVSLVTHKVPHKPDWLAFSDAYGLGCTLFDPLMKSEKWSLGGVAGNCWDGSMVRFSGEEIPTDFKEFDDLMEKLGVDFKTYRKLRCLYYLEETEEGDYYGGHTKYVRYVCDVKALYNTLKKEGLIDESANPRRDS